MSLPTSLGAYRDCQDLFDSAAKDPKGIRVGLGTYDACFVMRQRMHYFRTLDRKANASTYPAGHPIHGTSAWDDYVLRILRDEDNNFWLYIEPRSAQSLYIEGLSEVGDLIDVEGAEVHMIEHQTEGGE